MSPNLTIERLSALMGARPSSRAVLPASAREMVQQLALRAQEMRRAARPSRAMTLRAFVSMVPDDRPAFVVSDGMGVDSTAMLVGLWRLGVRPDVILHADTGDEHPATVAYRESRRAWLQSVGFPDLTIVRRAPSRSKKSGLAYATLGEKCLANATLPSLAFGGKACSAEWKIKPQERWLKTHALARKTWARGLKVVKAIGYDAGPLDSRRAHYLTSDDDYDYVYPLREWLWDRPRAIAEIRAAGLKVPRKSACVFCPASKPWEIAQIVAEWPQIADRIMEIEEMAKPNLREVEGLWRKTIKGMRGAVPRPGSMAVFIRALRADPELLRRYLAMAPLEEEATGADIGAVPRFGAAPMSKRRHLAMAHDFALELAGGGL